MSLNWKEINLILEELDLEGSQIQSVVQSAYDVMIFSIHKKGITKKLLVSLSSGACRLHETFSRFPKSDKPLRFAQFLNSRIVNGRIIEVCQEGDDRIVRFTISRCGENFFMYLRLWSNAANLIVTDDKDYILDVMRRLPKRGEITGGIYLPVKKEKPENVSGGQKIKIYEIREIPGEDSFNKKIDDYYAQKGGQLSLEALKEQVKNEHEGRIGRISAALERLREKERDFADASRYKVYGDLILSNISKIKPDDKWLETEENGRVIKIELITKTNQTGRVQPENPASAAGRYYEQYKKAKNALAEIQREILEGEQELKDLNEKLSLLLNESNPLILAKLIKNSGFSAKKTSLIKKEKTRPGLSFKRGEWLIIVGRDASENDELLRRHARGNDLWLHTRDYHGSYVFIKQRSGKSFPLDIMLDAGNLALFYSKGRNNGEGDLFYTLVKYLRRAKDGPKGLVIPTQEKNLHIKLDDNRLRSLESCKV